VPSLHGALWVTIETADSTARAGLSCEAGPQDRHYSH
jgi:hypothetical protein